MPKKLKRYYGCGEQHFVTFNCYRRLPLLATAYARNLFVKELDEVRHEYDFLLVGYVLMPNHVHLLISEPKKGSPSSALQMLKQRVSRKIRGQQHVVDSQPYGCPSRNASVTCQVFGSQDFTTSTCIATKRRTRSWITCTRIR